MSASVRLLPALLLLGGCHLLLGHQPGREAGTGAGEGRPGDGRPGDARGDGLPRTDAVAPPGCGDGKGEGTEACDGDDLRGQSCASLGFASGELRCAGCRLDASGCVLPAQRGRLVYGTSTGVAFRLLDTVTLGWGPQVKLPVVGSPRWIVNRSSPTDQRDEVAAVLAETPSDLRLHLLHLGSEGWTVDEVTAVQVIPLDRGARIFDLVYEAKSGEALVVYSNESANPRYRTYAKGTWSQPAAVFPGEAPGSSPVRFVSLAARPGSDEIALLYSDAETHVFRVIWNGSGFVIRADLTEHVLTGEPTSNPYQSFAAGYEGLSGELLDTVGSACCSCFSYCVKAATTCNQGCSGSWGYMRLAPREGGDEILLVGGERHAKVWSGVQWKATQQLNPPLVPTSREAIWWADGAWSKSPPAAIVVHRGWTDDPLDSGGRGKIFWGTYTSATGWSGGKASALKNMGELSWPQVEPLGSGGVIAVFSDDLGQLWAATSDTTTWVPTASNPVGVGLATAATRVFSLDLRR